MAPAQNLDITTQNADKYTHKKFQGMRYYAHKKFGTRSETLTNPINDIKETDAISSEQTAVILQNTQTTTKRSTSDLFRPYALPDNTSRKRKHSELLAESEVREEYNMEFKRFAATPPAIPSPSPPPPAYVAYQPPFLNPSSLSLNPNYYQEHYQFNPQTFALILRQQSAALCMGEILKRQGNLNAFNLMGQYTL